MEEAFAVARRKLGKQLDALIVPHALQALIRVADDAER
jgi:hypothetical protein